MNRKCFQIIALLLVSTLITGCQNNQNTANLINEVTENKTLSNNETKMKLTSPNFENNGYLPPEFTCDGQEMSPELHIADIPHGTKSLALIMDDPDAENGTWTHWLIWNIPKDTTVIPKNIGPGFATQGNNSWPKAEYGGPCPPLGTHRYFFRLFALSGELDLPSGATRAELEKAMESKIINQDHLQGIYKKSKGRK